MRDDLRRIPVTLVRHLAHADPLRRIDSEIIHFDRTNHQPDNATVRHRLHRIEELTGRSLSRPRDLAELCLVFEVERRLP